MYHLKVVRPLRCQWPALSAGSSLFFKKLLEALQVANANVGNGPVVEVPISPMEQVIALARDHLFGLAVLGRSRPNKQIDEMLAPLVNESCY